MKTETFKKLGDKRLMEEGIAAAFGSAEGGSLNGEGKVMPSISWQNNTNMHHQAMLLCYYLYVVF